MKYKIDKSWFTKDNPKGYIEEVWLEGKVQVKIGQKLIKVRRTEKLFTYLTHNEDVLEQLYNMGKEYIIKIEDKPKKKIVKPSKVKLVSVKNIMKKDEPKDINQESEEVSIQEKESE
jgi:hypothetical protein